MERTETLGPVWIPFGSLVSHGLVPRVLSPQQLKNVKQAGHGMLGQFLLILWSQPVQFRRDYMAPIG